MSLRLGMQNSKKAAKKCCPHLLSQTNVLFTLWIRKSPCHFNFRHPTISSCEEALRGLSSHKLFLNCVKCYLYCSPPLRDPNIMSVNKKIIVRALRIWILHTTAWILHRNYKQDRLFCPPCKKKCFFDSHCHWIENKMLYHTTLDISI